mmetsp:Transcript_5080/g.6730  ORF Transcript_5080/g.6730 Transcript_5080/m.6730 type:complete len:201 (-) Transcript_5080:616-1218(-)
MVSAPTEKAICSKKLVLNGFCFVFDGSANIIVVDDVNFCWMESCKKVKASFLSCSSKKSSNDIFTSRDVYIPTEYILTNAFFRTPTPMKYKSSSPNLGAKTIPVALSSNGCNNASSSSRCLRSSSSSAALAAASAASLACFSRKRRTCSASASACALAAASAALAFSAAIRCSFFCFSASSFCLSAPSLAAAAAAASALA